MGDRDELEVWLGGVYAGRLHRRDADVDFSYDRSYRAARTPALSSPNQGAVVEIARGRVAFASGTLHERNAPRASYM